VTNTYRIRSEVFTFRVSFIIGCDDSEIRVGKKFKSLVGI